MIIYKITGPTGKIYVGQTTQPLVRRIAGHKHSVKKFDYPLQKDFIKYGFENFVFEEIEKCSSLAELKEKEEAWIKKLKSFVEGYNLSAGDGSYGSKRTVAQRRAMSLMKKRHAKKLGKIFYSENSKKMWKNKETRKKLIESAKRRSHPEEMAKRQAASVLAKIAKKPGILVKDKSGKIVFKCTHLADCSRKTGLSFGAINDCINKKRINRRFDFEFYKKDGGKCL